MLGTYLHGIFDTPEFTKKLLKILFKNKGIDTDIPEIEPPALRQERELDRLAGVLRQSLDWEMIYRITGV